MRINYIKLCNISSYSSECFFDFNLDENRNIILIGGQNGTGKTSLFTALKLGLYGHLCFNYQSSNSPMYLSKIKDLINHDAFTTDKINAHVEVEIEVPGEREYIKYIVRRDWSYINQKITENLKVLKDGTALKSNEIIFFQNYLFTILPPNLFDFFFFDGEQIADFFATNSYNSYIKNALLTLCSFDTFETIRKFCYNHIDNSTGEDDTMLSTYREMEESIEQLSIDIKNQKEQVTELERQLLDISDKKISLSDKFKNAGGLTEKEKLSLLEKSKEQEKIKNEMNLRAKSFVESKMPFIITKDFADKIKLQLSAEQEHQKYSALSGKLNSDIVRNTIMKTMIENDYHKADENFITSLVDAILNTVKLDLLNEETFNLLHDLSKEQQNKAYTVLSYIDNFTTKGILKILEAKEKASAETVDINKQLRDAMSEIDTEKYSSTFDALSKEELEMTKKFEELNSLIISNEDKLRVAKETCEKMRTQLQQNAKNRNIYEITNKVSDALDSVIKTLTATKFKGIETNMLLMLKKIMRKDNFIDMIELDDNFNIFLYKEQAYTLSELKNLLKNVGTDELVKRIGSKGVERLLSTLGAKSISELKASIKKLNGQMSLIYDNEYNLYKKIEFNQLSKGEKQIFILSLYYAIIKVSNKDIPFIIDTPYARIDTEHREQISTVFFPTISEQVIILSTDEEITLPYYKVLKPFIAKEYLLDYNEAESKTTVRNGYFFKEWSK